MFTGLVEAVGELVERKPTGGGFRLRIATPLAPELAPGDSLAVNGVCLTVILAERRRGSRRRRTGNDPRDDARRRWRAAALVNLERPLRADSRFGGHFVQGHVDAIGHVEELRADAEFHWLTVSFPPQLAPLHRAQGIDRGRRHQPDGRRARRRSLRHAGRAVHDGAHQPRPRRRSATASTSNATWSASTSSAPRNWPA